ncbi:MAG: TlpA disulfide reductase family protein [Acidobacteriota bacterium]
MKTVPQSRFGAMRAVLALTTLLAASGCGGQGAVSNDRVASGIQVPVELVPATAPEVLQAVRDSGGRAVLVNIWATWCPPCLEEMPEILRFRKDYLGQGVEVILVSGDWDTETQQVEAFLRELGVDFPTYLKAGDDMEFIEAMSPEWSGALPASFLYDSGGTLRHMWEGKVTYANLQEKVLPILETSQSQVKKEEIS